MEDAILFLFLSLGIILAGVVVLMAGLRHRTRTIELLHEERLAMIERGMVPPPLSAGGFDGQPGSPLVGTRSRSFSIGIIIVGLGLSLMTVIGVAGEAPSVGIGVGGGIALLGASFIVRALFADAPRAPSSGVAPPRRAAPVVTPPPPAPPPPPSDPA